MPNPTPFRFGTTEAERTRPSAPLPADPPAPPPITPPGVPELSVELLDRVHDLHSELFAFEDNVRKALHDQAGPGGFITDDPRYMATGLVTDAIATLVDAVRLYRRVSR